MSPGGEGDWTDVCAADAIAEGGAGVRFALPRAIGGADGGFAVRVGGAARAYVNRCAHVPVELDSPPGRFLDDTGRVVVCATHGARYHGDTGACAGGPCRGRPLLPLPARERAGRLEVLLPRAD